VVTFSLANPQMFRWYSAPFLPAYFLAIWLGLWALVESATASARRGALRTALIAAPGLAAALLSLNAWTLAPDHGPDAPAPQMAWHKIELLYRRVGEGLRAAYDVGPNTLVAAGDIGAVGYYSGARILDTVGLVTPEMSAYYPVAEALLIEGANYAVPPAIMRDYQPDYVVLMEQFVRHGLARDPTFRDRYRQIRFIPTDFYGTGMLVYQRRDLASD
jgi:hypothetical protein